MCSSRSSSADPSGVPFDVATERLIWRIPTMNVSTEPTTDETAAIRAAPIASQPTPRLQTSFERVCLMPQSRSSSLFKVPVGCSLAKRGLNKC